MKKDINKEMIRRIENEECKKKIRKEWEERGIQVLLKSGTIPLKYISAIFDCSYSTIYKIKNKMKQDGTLK